MKTIEKKSPITNEWNSMEMDITDEQFERILNRYETKELLQNIVPDLSKEEREFIISGYTIEEQKTLFGYDAD